MPSPLLERQVSLLRYLTSGTAIFADVPPPLDPALYGFDPRLLWLEARLSHRKRIEKITTVFQKTFQILQSDGTALIREFVDAYPPTDIQRIENARQFYEFLCAQWLGKLPDPPYLRDVASCELACAAIHGDAEERTLPNGMCAQPGCVRRRPGVVLMRCAYDIQPVFESHWRGAAPLKRDTPLAIATMSGTQRPQVFELLPAVFDVLAALDNWTDRSALGLQADADEFISDLAAHGMLEVSQ
jgi:hypothetical protein